MSDSKSNLTLRILIGMVLGVLVGRFFSLWVSEQTDTLINLGLFELSVKSFFIEGLFHIGGEIFVTSLKMLVVPLVFVSLVCGTCSLNDSAKIGRLGLKSVILYLLTTAIAITLALTIANFISPGEGAALTTDAEFEAATAPTFAEVIIGMFPSNPIQAMATGNMLQIIVFSILFGISMAMAGDAGKKLSLVFNDLNQVVLKMVTILMNLAPYGVFCLLAKLFAFLELSEVLKLGKYFFTLVAVLLIHAFVTYPILFKLLTGLNPVQFLTKMKATALFAFSTSSSNATMPVTLNTVTKKMGADNSIASFTVPLGATINMDGTAIMQGVATVFIAQVYAIDLSMADYLAVLLTATLASIGTAGVPGVGLIMLAMVFQQVGLPVEGIALILGVDRLLDMTRTAVNVTGDAMVTCAVAKSEKALDKDVFNSPSS
ncbi:dicarboxylate/amino acid:cation symporter [Catenovulum adriaticum]|uniref:Dicarboxylate/amino acid:cation symporter n=1 Tax=Catenovulum adriaticum TaxID=2984846 RepID=A0ABY7AQQ3_9ALTE|nr:dicarboxylate/amino acid:cation symporter [Catenovulum sp. TS8]WAJ71597.1 dicarboxylate/amino acid:cation symporter [Catenovulum sp. TS8]